MPVGIMGPLKFLDTILSGVYGGFKGAQLNWVPMIPKAAASRTAVRLIPYGNSGRGNREANFCFNLAGPHGLEDRLMSIISHLQKHTR